MRLSLSAIRRLLHARSNMLSTAADIRHVDIIDTDMVALERAMATMPAHPDAAAGPRQFSEQGYRTVAISNSAHRADRPSPVNRRQLTVDSTMAFKPSTRSYLQAAAEPGVELADGMPVAAHT
jgi:2-haloacid dehalogenase